jgi:hydroxymethylpyrimidine/phosphomethylpyrimidine kinase
MLIMTRQAAPDERPVTLTIAGSDSGGGAGIQADIKTMEAGGAFATSALTAVTAQHTQGVESTFTLPVEETEAQIDAVLSDFDVAAVKTGMLATAPMIRAVHDRTAALQVPLVVDPVMVAASGDRLLDPSAEDAYLELLGDATLATPNADEAAVLTDIEVDDRESAIEAGEAIRGSGVDAVLVKGGHVPGDTVTDVLVTPDGVETFEHPRIDTEATHGSGCTLASAIATRLAHGEDLSASVEAGVDLLQRAVRYHHDVGQGPGAVHHAVELRTAAAAEETQAAVARTVEAFVDRDVSPLVPEVGMNVVAATPYAESPAETAAIEGRISRTGSGITPAGDVGMGASSHVARFLLGAREAFPDLSVAVNCRFNEEIKAALESLEGPVVEIDRREEPAPDAEGSTMGWAARAAADAVAEPPAVVHDRGAMGKEPITRVIAPDAATARERVFTLLDALEA